MDFEDIPMAPAGVGFNSTPTKWIYSEYGRFLSVYGIYNGISVTFNLASADDIKNKLKILYTKRDNGMLSNDDLQELEERLRIMSNVNFYGNGSQDQTKAALQEQVKPTTSEKQLNHMRKIQPLSHSDEANHKRRKTLEEKRNLKILGLS